MIILLLCELEMSVTSRAARVIVIYYDKRVTFVQGRSILLDDVVVCCERIWGETSHEVSFVLENRIVG